MAFDLIAELEALVDALARGHVEYAICGGLALALHGHPRATMDIDLLVPSDQLPAAVAVAATLGFDVPARKMTFGLRAGAPREVQRVSKPEPGSDTLLSLDLLIVGASLDEVWRGRTRLRVGDREMVVVSRAGLATMKRLAGRAQDLADVAALEGTEREDEG